MMKRKLLILTWLLFLFSSNVSARILTGSSFFDHFTIGAEWGYTQCLLQSRNYNFISEEGYRIYENNTAFRAHANAQVLGHIGYRLSEQTSLALYSGYMGMGKDNRLLPLMLRLSFFPSTDNEDGLFVYGQGGVAWHVHATAGRMAWLASLGGGYRFRLAWNTNLDLLFGIKYLHDHPSIPNPEGPGNVPEHNIRMNNAGYCALDVSIAISF